MADEPATVGPKLFNSKLEAGLRALAILDAFYPRCLDLNEMSLFDYFVVHSRDVGGPVSLHPELASRTGEYLIRRRLVEDGIKLMYRAHLIRLRNEESGVKFQASDEASAFLDLMEKPYNGRLKKCARWLADESAKKIDGEFERFLRQSIDKWTVEFEDGGGPSGPTK